MKDEILYTFISMEKKEKEISWPLLTTESSSSFMQ